MLPSVSLNLERLPEDATGPRVTNSIIEAAGLETSRIAAAYNPRYSEGVPMTITCLR